MKKLAPFGLHVFKMLQATLSFVGLTKIKQDNKMEQDTISTFLSPKKSVHRNNNENREFSLWDLCNFRHSPEVYATIPFGPGGGQPFNLGLPDL